MAVLHAAAHVKYNREHKNENDPNSDNFFYSFVQFQSFSNEKKCQQNENFTVCILSIDEWNHNLIR